MLRRARKPRTVKMSKAPWISACVALLLIAGGAALLAFGIKWELEYKRGFDASVDGEIRSFSKVPSQSRCDVSYVYVADKTTYTGVSRRDCVFALFSKTRVDYKSASPHCSRMSSGASAAHASSDDLTSCDSLGTRMRRQVAIAFGAILIVIGIGASVFACAFSSSKSRVSNSPVPKPQEEICLA